MSTTVRIARFQVIGGSRRLGLVPAPVAAAVAPRGEGGRATASTGRGRSVDIDEGIVGPTERRGDALVVADVDGVGHGRVVVEPGDDGHAGPLGTQGVDLDVDRHRIDAAVGVEHGREAAVRLHVSELEAGVHAAPVGEVDVEADGAAGGEVVVVDRQRVTREAPTTVRTGSVPTRAARPAGRERRTRTPG